MATRVKRYEDKLERLDDLLARVEREMGPQVELEAREFNRGGVLGLGSQRMIEVIATLDTGSNRASAAVAEAVATSPAAQARPAASASAQASRGDYAGLEDRLIQRLPRGADVFEQHSAPRQVETARSQREAFDAGTIPARRVESPREQRDYLAGEMDTPRGADTPRNLREYLGQSSDSARVAETPRVNREIPGMAGASPRRVETQRGLREALGAETARPQLPDDAGRVEIADLLLRRAGQLAGGDSTRTQSSAEDQLELDEIRRSIGRLQGTVDMLLTLRTGSEQRGSSANEPATVERAVERSRPAEARSEARRSAVLELDQNEYEVLETLLSWDYRLGEALELLHECRSGRISGTSGLLSAVLRTAKQQISEGLSFAGGLGDELPEGQLLVIFVGPPGSGKTTTIAKLAAQLSYRSGRGCGLISLDASRAGADVQLRAYARLMGLPCEHASSAEEYREVLSRLADCDIVLVDTAGIPGGNAEQLAELERLIAVREPQQLHLVLPATTRRSDFEQAAAAYLPLGCNRAVLTRLDETGSPACLANLGRLAGLPLSYLADGQHIPRGIHSATPGFLGEWMNRTVEAAQRG